VQIYLKYLKKDKTKIPQSLCVDVVEHIIMAQLAPFIHLTWLGVFLEDF